MITDATDTDFQAGDYVVATHAKFDDFGTETFKVTQVTRSALSLPLVVVVDGQGNKTSFYPEELELDLRAPEDREF